MRHVEYLASVPDYSNLYETITRMYNETLYTACWKGFYDVNFMLYFMDCKTRIYIYLFVDGEYTANAIIGVSDCLKCFYIHQVPITGRTAPR